MFVWGWEGWVTKLGATHQLVPGSTVTAGCGVSPGHVTNASDTEVPWSAYVHSSKALAAVERPCAVHPVKQGAMHENQAKGGAESG